MDADGAICFASEISLFFNDCLKPIISGSTGPIFLIFLPSGRYLIVDYISGLFSDPLRDVVMAANFGAKLHIQIVV